MNKKLFHTIAVSTILATLLVSCGSPTNPTAAPPTTAPTSAAPAPTSSTQLQNSQQRRQVEAPPMW